MILQALHGLYVRKQDELPPEGFEQKEIPFLIVLNGDGTFGDFQDTRNRSGKKLIARQFRVPKDSGRSGKNAWQSANLLWDHYGYVLCWPKSDSDADKEMARKQHGTFVERVGELAAAYPQDKGVQAVMRFLKSDEREKLLEHPAWEECRKIPGCNLSFRLSDELSLVCESDNVREFVAKSSAQDDDEDDSTTGDVEGICLVTGESATVARLHPRTPIIGAKSNAKIVSFQKNMGFDSYGRQQSYNAPTSKGAAFAYTTALNHLLAKESRQKLLIGSDTMVFWAGEKHRVEDLFADLFGEPAKENLDQTTQAIRSLYTAPQAGTPPLDHDLTPFFVLGLAPNAARIAVRFWHAGTVGETARHIRQHFDDCAVVHGPNQPEYLSLFRLLVSTAMQGKSENIPPNLAGDLMKSILAGTPYPQSLLSAAIRRCRAEREITYPRVSVIKAVLARGTRYYTSNEQEVGMALDVTNTNPGYRLGRLFAVLEKIQEEASPGINATIRDRFYGAASGTPVAAFPHLMKLKNHHLAKLENRGRAVNLEKIVGEIMDGLDDFPTHLSLQDQGRFAVGYYHQRQDFFKKNETTTNVNP
ncbi:CRISPR-associated protein, Csd1 family [Geobacter metallireducens RCH3]|uniref:CRISPR-associated protein Csd1 n=1 Tax=Geobacter metallireducens (strain ATCC 53774 / DSM 7210 / GS-15) TaxID=269799 RepID=Q39WR8_GEOMG|nr:type I-C CRISPR-associated protein Cas8c/Csd1 [Geobacter metallireducens]ABB31306.1 CRISPR-associated protein Csd1 [Geobacter metallireducens GS-15]EHP86556.1 CRISPR-associated protein, Csd1 family [Geobacter metallireducens RCH3]